MLINKERCQQMVILPIKENDLDFVVSIAAPDFEDKERLKQLVKEDEAFRRGILGNKEVFNEVLNAEAFNMKVSPELFFEILLRRAYYELKESSHTMEKFLTQRVPVFDSKQVVKFLEKEVVVQYLAGLLFSFMRTESFVFKKQIKKGVWRKIRVSDMDIDTLTTLSWGVDDDLKFYFYKRIADVCLFIPGMFPEHTSSQALYPISNKSNPVFTACRKRRSVQDFENEGKKYYRLASEHELAETRGLDMVLSELVKSFTPARKALNYISDNYLYLNKSRIFNQN